MRILRRWTSAWDSGLLRSLWIHFLCRIPAAPAFATSRVGLHRSVGCSRGMSTDKQITVSFTKEMEKHNCKYRVCLPIPLQDLCQLCGMLAKVKVVEPIISCHFSSSRQMIDLRRISLSYYSLTCQSAAHAGTASRLAWILALKRESSRCFSVV